MAMSQHKPGMENTSGATDPVWISTLPYSKYPQFTKLSQDLETDVLVVGAGITGISTAYELVEKGHRVTLIDARNVLSGETGRTSAHLSSALDDHYYELEKTFGNEKAKLAYDSHQWALEHVGEIVKKLGLDCEYRTLPGYVIVDVPVLDESYKKHDDLEKEFAAVTRIGHGDKVHYTAAGRIGDKYEGGLLKFDAQATFHPTKYLVGILEYLKTKPQLFSCYTNTRFIEHKDHGTYVSATTEDGHTIRSSSLVMATNVPLNIIEVIGKVGFYRTYCVALRAPKGAFPDQLIYTNSDPYIYVKKTAHPDPKYEYVVIGGEDHKVAIDPFKDQHPQQQHLTNLIQWGKSNFSYLEDAEYQWSGQIIEPNDYMAFIGRAAALEKNVYIATGDSGNGLTHGVIASKLIPDLISSTPNPWTDLYSPARLPKPRTIPHVVVENVKQQVAGYGRFLKTDVSDIEDIPRCSGAVMHASALRVGMPMKPMAVYKDAEGKVFEFSAVCPHLHGVVAWNDVEKSWDCPVHGSRYESLTGRCVMGPSNRNLYPENDAAKEMASATGQDVQGLPNGGAGAKGAGAKVALEASGIPGAHSK